MKKLLLALALTGCTTVVVPNPPGPPPPPPPVLPPPPAPPPAPPPVVVTPQKMEMAINTSANDYWAVGRWNDAAHSFSGWFFWDSTNTGKTGTVSYTATSYPTSDAQCISYMNDYPAGVYTLTWQGKATFSIPWAKSFVVTGPNSASVTLNANTQLYLKVTGLDATQPLNSVHLYLPGQGPNSPMYRAEYIANLASIPIVSVRTMPDQSHATDTDVEWANRVKVDNWSYTDKAPPWETEIQFAKEAHLKRLWVNAPIQASDDYLKQMATLFHSTLPSGIELMVEYSNECWNWGGGYKCWPYVNAEGNTNHPALYDGNIVNGVLVPSTTLVTDSYTRAARVAADRAYHVAQIFHSVYSDRPQDMNMILAGQAAWTAWTQSGLEWIAAKYGTPSKWFKYSAIAPYFDYNWNNGQYKPVAGWLTVSDLLTASGKFIDNDLPGQLDSHKALANKYGLDLIDYEGGQSFFSTVNPYSATNIATLAQRDQAMGTIYAKYFAALQAHGVNIHFEFAYVSEPYSKSGYWDILQSLEDTVNNPRWQSLIDYNKAK